MHRLARLPGSPYALAAGFACGAAVSFTPMVGLHFVFSAILAFLIRANILASAIGTAVGNPWTFAFIWPSMLGLGQWLFGIDEEIALPDQWSLNTLYHFIVDHFFDGFLPWLMVSIPVGAIVWLIFYVPLRSVIENRQQARRDRITGKKEDAPNHD